MRKISVLSGLALAGLMLLGQPSPAAAGGYDTPMLYSARHMGQGGTAVAWVNDASAMFHNPAGLGHTERANLIVDVSLLTGTIIGTPSEDCDMVPGEPDLCGNATSIESEQTVAPLFLLGGSYRFTDWLVGGVGFYPVASAGADYVYSDTMGTSYTDNTTLLFLEGSVGLTLDFTPWGVPGLRIGASWRITYVSLEREQEYSGISFDASGVSMAGFRVGVQYQPIDELELGVNWRSKTSTDIDDPEGTLEGVPGTIPISTTFTLPDRLVFGVAGNVSDFRLSTDVEIGFNGENDVQVITGGNVDLDNILQWKHAVTLRYGVEYRAMQDRLPIRAGYVWDSQTASKAYPTAFGTPPAPTNVVTAGLGWIEDDWQLNVAYAYRWGGTTVDDPLTSAGCIFCGGNGDYEISLHGIYLDFSYDW